jgi:hypothetical protein
MTKWNRIEDGYETDGAAIYDNGNGFGSAKNSGRWAVEIEGRWIANVDYLSDAKTLAEKNLEAVR